MQRPAVAGHVLVARPGARGRAQARPCRPLPPAHAGFHAGPRLQRMGAVGGRQEATAAHRRGRGRPVARQAALGGPGGLGGPRGDVPAAAAPGEAVAGADDQPPAGPGAGHVGGERVPAQAHRPGGGEVGGRAGGAPLPGRLRRLGGDRRARPPPGGAHLQAPRPRPPFAPRRVRGGVARGDPGEARRDERAAGLHLPEEDRHELLHALVLGRVRPGRAGRHARPPPVHGLQDHGCGVPHRAALHPGAREPVARGGGVQRARQVGPALVDPSQGPGDPQHAGQHPHGPHLAQPARGGDAHAQPAAAAL
mmetsp:Transcript_22744/g.70671  ORF Transcript_22744/g.70671 Transcript_22744/m.70671 type:complete len:308 (+) Transcript_22744:885-1808(+)